MSTGESCSRSGLLFGAGLLGDFHCGVILTRLLDVRESEGSEDEDYWIEEVGEL